MRYSKQQARQQTGFTLIELLLYVSIISTLLLGISMFFALSADARLKNQTINEIDQQGAFAIDTITQTVRNAASITTPAAGTAGSSLSLVMPAGGLSPTVLDLDNGTLRIKEGSSPAIPLTSNLITVTNLTIKNLTRDGTNGIIQINLTLSRTNPNNRNEYDYTKTFTASAEIRP